MNPHPVESARRQWLPRLGETPTWLILNAAVVGGGAGILTPALRSEQDTSLATNASAAVLFVLLARAPAALADWHLVRRGRARAVLVSHALAAGFGLLVSLGDSPEASSQASDQVVMTGFALAATGYLATAFVLLPLVALYVFVRRLQNPYRSVHRRRRPSRSAWQLNGVLVTTVTILIVSLTPAADDTAVGVDFFATLCAAVVFRAPGAWAEWVITGRGGQRAVYWTHGIVAGLTILMQLSTAGSSAASNSVDGMGRVAETLVVYLGLSSLVMVCVLAVMLPLRALLRRSRGAVDPSLAASFPNTMPRIAGPAATSAQSPEAGRDATCMPERSLDTATGSNDGRDEASPAVAIPTARAPIPRTPAPAALVDPAPPVDRRSSVDSDTRAVSIRNEIGFTVGTTTGIASLIQGFDSTDPVRTGAVALTVGVVAVTGVFWATRRRDPQRRRLPDGERPPTSTAERPRTGR
ncbi:hypothetical protein [Micromonospora sp. NPDC049645]|uniref:hypothetical protein n=1 Tax=Micromonospora sp. NPDC049645 TaxID=3155508 RepID=UPI003425506E